MKEYAVDHNGKKIIQVSKNYFRPSEVEKLLGDYKKAKKILGWKPSISFDELITEMVQDKILQIETNENKKR